MSLVITADAEQICVAIAQFPANYHRDYENVRGLAAAYLASPNRENTRALAQMLTRVLRDWGAGRRRAAFVQKMDVLQTSLQAPELHERLRYFADLSVEGLSIRGGRRAVNGQQSHEALGIFDARLHAVLDQLSAGIFVGNTNVTYPMKTLMLLTGFMPAFDSQVRSGLDNAGFMGMNATQFLLPEDSAGANARKISRLPFYLGNCYNQYRELLKGAVARSPQPRLTRDPGRLFDVLFFMQGRKDSARLLSFEPESRWYALP